MTKLSDEISNIKNTNKMYRLIVGKRKPPLEQKRFDASNLRRNGYYGELSLTIAGLLVKALSKDESLFLSLVDELEPALRAFFYEDEYDLSSKSLLTTSRSLPYQVCYGNALYYVKGQFWRAKFDDVNVTISSEMFSTVLKAFNMDKSHFYRMSVEINDKNGWLEYTPFDISYFINFEEKIQPALRNLSSLTDTDIINWLLSPHGDAALYKLQKSHHPLLQSSTLLFLAAGFNKNHCCEFMDTICSAYKGPDKALLMELLPSSTEICGLLRSDYGKSRKGRDYFLHKKANLQLFENDDVSSLHAIIKTTPLLLQLLSSSNDEALKRFQSIPSMSALLQAFQKHSKYESKDTDDHKLRAYLDDVWLTRGIFQHLNTLCGQLNSAFDRWAALTMIDKVTACIECFFHRHEMPGLIEEKTDHQFTDNILHMTLMKDWGHDLNLSSVGDVLARSFIYCVENYEAEHERSVSVCKRIIALQSKYLPLKTSASLLTSKYIEKSEFDALFSREPQLQPTRTMTFLDLKHAGYLFFTIHQRFGQCVDSNLGNYEHYIQEYARLYNNSLAVPLESINSHSHQDLYDLSKYSEQRL